MKGGLRRIPAIYELPITGSGPSRRKGTRSSSRQIVRDGSSGYGYEYRRRSALVKGKSRMELSHSLMNIGKNAIETQSTITTFLYWTARGRSRERR